MSAVIYSITERDSHGIPSKYVGKGAEIKYFSDTWLRAREERCFARIERIEAVREDDDGEVMLEVWYRTPNVTNDGLWFPDPALKLPNPDLSFVANVSGRWLRFEVSNHSGWSDRMAVVRLRPATYRADEYLFADYPSNAILVESNGRRALFSRTGRLPLAP